MAVDPPPVHVENMEVAQGAAAELVAPCTQPITAEFLLKALRENKEDIVKSFNSNINALAKKVDQNSIMIRDGAEAVERNMAGICKQKTEIERLTSRVSALESSGARQNLVALRRASLSADYLAARRSVRLWPVAARDESELWEGVGNFLHGMMGISEDDMSQDDIEGIVRVEGPPLTDRIRDEVIVRFFDKRKRDVVFSNAPGLATAIDGDGRPTAGLRLEIPPEMDDTFRLLSCFGTRLRARHGDGTKRHIKFDEFAGSLYANVKLLGDTTWTRVTPEMARQDLETSMREEDSHHQRRLASKLVPGPRERLSRPPPATSTSGRLRGTLVGDSSRQRPRWRVPNRHPRPGRSV